MTYAVETATNGSESEAFTEADEALIELQAEEIEALEAETEADLESISIEDVAEDLEAYFEGDTEAEEGLERRRSRRRPRNPTNKRLLKTFTAMIKKLVLKAAGNPKTRDKLKAACKKGPKAVAKLLIPSIKKQFPKYLQWLVEYYVPPIVARLYKSICRLVARKAGVKPEEVEAADASAEFSFASLIPTAIDLASSLF